jgi:hypothetical protein
MSEIDFYSEKESPTKALSQNEAFEKRRAMAEHIYKSAGLVTHLAVFGIMLAGLACFVWMIVLLVKKEDPLPAIVIGVLCIPAWGAVCLDDIGKAQKTSAAYYWLCRCCMWYVKLLGGLGAICLGWAAIENGVGALDLKSIGIIIIVLLALILFQMGKREK